MGNMQISMGTFDHFAGVNTQISTQTWEHLKTDTYLDDGKPLIEKMYDTRYSENAPASVKLFNDAGNCLYTLEDLDFDGWADEIYATEYDEQQRRIGGRTDLNGDGYSDWIQTVQYNEDGTESLTLTDNNGDFKIDSKIFTKTDLDGNEILKSFDFEADGIYDSTTAYNHITETVSYGEEYQPDDSLKH